MYGGILHDSFCHSNQFYGVYPEHRLANSVRDTVKPASLLPSLFKHFILVKSDRVPF